MVTNARKIAECYDFPTNPTRAYEMVNEARERDDLETLIVEFAGLLKDESSNIRVGAVEALGTIPEANCAIIIGALIAVLGDAAQRDYSYGGLNADEDDMRTPGQCAASILGRWKARAAIGPMINILSNIKIWPWNLIACIRALGEIKATEAIPALRELVSCNVIATWGVHSIDEQVHIGRLAQETIDLILTNGT